MEQSPFWEADSHSASQEFPNLLRNPKVRHRVHNSPPLVSILSQINSIHNLPFISQRSILILSSRLLLGLILFLFPSEFPTKIFYTFLSSFKRATYPASRILLDLLTLITFGELYKLWSPSICSLLQPSDTLPPIGPNIILSTLFSNFPNLCSSLMWETKFHTHTKHEVKL